MSDEENYIIENETTDTAKKQEYWNTGIGLNKVDNLEPSKYLLDLSQKNINGELKYNEVENLLKTYYKTQNSNDINIQKEKECDLVSLRIAMALEDKSFGFSPITLKNIHKYLFKDIYDFAGNYRNYNITKKEDILNGDTVKYVNYQDIESYFDYDFKEEKEFDYSKLNKDELKALYLKSGLPLKRFFNTSGNLYKEKHLKDILPTLSEDEQLELLSTNGMLVKRPILETKDKVLVGFKEEQYKELL